MRFIRKTLGGLNAAYYFRHFVFGAALSGLYLYMMSRAPENIKAGVVVFLLISLLLYPYSRFVYERIVGFILGNNIFVMNSLIMLATKFITMVLCLAFSIFIAPMGLAYLYFYHTKADKNANLSQNR